MAEFRSQYDPSSANTATPGRAFSQGVNSTAMNRPTPRNIEIQRRRGSPLAAMPATTVNQAISMALLNIKWVT
jgi:hypothetical protein